jgi:hypothetical protein
LLGAKQKSRSWATTSVFDPLQMSDLKSAMRREQARLGLREHQITSGHHRQMAHALWQQGCLEVDSQLQHVGVVDETRRTYRHQR